MIETRRRKTDSTRETVLRGTKGEFCENCKRQVFRIRLVSRSTRLKLSRSGMDTDRVPQVGKEGQTCERDGRRTVRGTTVTEEIYIDVLKRGT